MTDQAKIIITHFRLGFSSFRNFEDENLLKTFQSSYLKLWQKKPKFKKFEKPIFDNYLLTDLMFLIFPITH